MIEFLSALASLVGDVSTYVGYGTTLVNNLMAPSDSQKRIMEAQDYGKLIHTQDFAHAFNQYLDERAAIRPTYAASNEEKLHNRFANMVMASAKRDLKYYDPLQDPNRMTGQNESNETRKQEPLVLKP
jgi:hypothetical protein